MTSSRLWRLGSSLCLVLLTFSVFLPRAEAHRNDQSYLYLDIGVTMTARLQMPFADLNEALGMDIAGSFSGIERSIGQNSTAIAQYASDHVRLTGSDGNWKLTPLRVERAGDFIKHVEVYFEIDHPDDFRQFDLRLDPFFDEIDDRDALVIVANDLERGIISNEAEHIVRFTPDGRVNSVDLGKPQGQKNFMLGIDLGLDHIRTGPDHVLFIVALMLPSVVESQRSWRPTPNFMATLWRILKVMTMFTVAHSVTFSLAGLGLVPQPNARLVETVIAVSIAATALNNIRPIWSGKDWVIAFGFGLFHGFGFASLVGELEVARSTQLVSLLGRNVGIELGQTIVVVLVFPLLFLLRRLWLYRGFAVVVSFVLALAGSIWALERITDRETTFISSLDGWLEYPRVVIYIAIATVLAAATRWSTARYRPQSMLSPS